MRSWQIVLICLLISVFIVAGCAKPAPAPAPAPKPTPAPAPPEQTIKILASRSGTASYILAFESGRLLKERHPWLRVSAMESSGTRNAAILADESESWPDTISLSSGASMERVIAEEPRRAEGLDDARQAFSYGVFGPVFFLTFDDKIKTPMDLVGKRIGLGTKAQSLWGALPAAILQAWGVLDKVTINYLGTGPAVTALIDGAVDVCVATVYSGIGEEAKVVPTKPLSDALATGKRLYYVSSASKEEAEKAKAIDWVPASLPAGSIEYQEHDIWGLAAPLGYFCHKTMPEELVYELTKFLVANYKEFWAAHASLQILTPATLGYPSGRPLHPGTQRALQEYAKANPNADAIKYYKEWGLLK